MINMSATTANWGDVSANRRQSWFDRLPHRRPSLIKCGMGGDLVVGTATRFHIKSRHARSAWLRIRDDEGGEVYDGIAPPTGFILISPVSTSPMRVRLTLEPHGGRPVDYEWTMVAKALPPAIWMARAPSRAHVGETFPVAWKAGGGVTVDVEGCGFHEQRVGHGEGTFILRPEQSGVMVLNFTATSRYGSSVKTRVVNVIEIAPRITVERPAITGRPGDEAVFAWSITGAAETWLEARGERLPVPPVGSVAAVIGLDPEELRLVAKGKGGTAMARLSVIPRLLTGLD
jgi:hypothetical protein